MTCIYCGKSNVTMAKSHVISNFIRKRITGIEDANGIKKFHFRWIDRPDLPHQDLPKPYLLCKKHDTEFGIVIEGPASQALIPENNNFATSIEVPRRWVVRDVSFNLGERVAFSIAEHKAENFESDDAMRRFAVLTAWRALHDMKLDGNSDVVEFLASPEGKILDKETVKFLNLETTEADFSYQYFAEIYLVGPVYAAQTTASVDDLPFAYAYLNQDSQSCIAVLLGLWVIIWPLIPDSHKNYNLQNLRQLVLVDWNDYLRKCFTKEKVQLGRELK